MYEDEREIGHWATVCGCVCARLHMCVFYYDMMLERRYYEKWFAERRRKKLQGKESGWDVEKIGTVSSCFARPLK